MYIAAESTNLLTAAGCANGMPVPQIGRDTRVWADLVLDPLFHLFGS